MAHVNFDRWAMPGLDLTMGGKTYTVPAPHGERLNLAIPAFRVRRGIPVRTVQGGRHAGDARRHRLHR